LANYTHEPNEVLMNDIEDEISRLND